jgi:sugar phosphate isomerase/epimerase
MDRRQFLQAGLGATVLSPILTETTTAQAQSPTAAEILAAHKIVPVTRKLVLDAHSRNLHWLRSADEVAEAAIEMVCGGVCPTVQPYPGHVDPEKVAQQLPAFIKRVRSHGLRVTQIKGPALRDATEPNAERIIATAAQSGCTHYSIAGYTYDFGKPLAPQLEAIKVRIDRFVRLNQKHKIALVYQTAPGPTSVGAVVLDLLPVMKQFDPKFIGFHWDTGHMAMHGDDMWETLMRLAGPYVAAVGWRDRGWIQDLGLKGEGGPYTGPPARVEPLVTLPDGSAMPGTPAPPGAARGGRAGGRGAAGGGRGGGGRAGAAGGEEGAAPQGRRGGGGPANSAGAGSIDADNPIYRSLDGEMPKRPIGGKNAKGAGWTAPLVAMGTGVVHIPRVATVLSEIGFNGPSELQSEYGGIGGAESGADKITRPRQFVLGMLKRDVITIRKSFEMANTGLGI